MIQTALRPTAIRLEYAPLRLSWKMALALTIGAFVALTVWGTWLSKEGRRLRAERAERDRAEAPVLRLLGEKPAWVGQLLRPAYYIRSPITILDHRPEAALQKIGFESKPLAERVAVCRATRFGTPAEAILKPAVPLVDPAQVLGPPASRYRVKNRFTGKSVEYWKYGDLHLGLLDGDVIVVRVY